MNQPAIDHAVLTAALATPEDGVAKPDRAPPTSAIRQIAALKVGETWSKSQPLERDVTLGEYMNNSVAWREALGNGVRASVRHAKNRTGGTYRVEVGDFISTSRVLYLVCVVTRTA